MEMDEFTRDLPEDTKCDCCGRVVPVDWRVSRFGPRDWLGLCMVRCSKCHRMKVAAAGSSVEAHQRAQKMRMELLYQVRAYDVRVAS